MPKGLGYFGKKKKKGKKPAFAKGVADITMVSATGAVASMGLASIGGAAATHGQQGIAGATRFLPAAGTVMGAGMLLGAVKGLESSTKAKRKKKR